MNRILSDSIHRDASRTRVARRLGHDKTVTPETCLPNGRSDYAFTTRQDGISQMVTTPTTRSEGRVREDERSEVRGSPVRTDTSKIARSGPHHSSSNIEDQMQQVQISTEGGVSSPPTHEYMPIRVVDAEDAPQHQSQIRPSTRVHTPLEQLPAFYGSVREVLDSVKVSSSRYPRNVEVRAVLDLGLTGMVDNLMSLKLFKQMSGGKDPTDPAVRELTFQWGATYYPAKGPILLDLAWPHPCGPAKQIPIWIVTDEQFDVDLTLGKSIVDGKKLRHYGKQETAKTDALIPFQRTIVVDPLSLGMPTPRGPKPIPREPPVPKPKPGMHH